MTTLIFGCSLALSYCIVVSFELYNQVTVDAPTPIPKDTKDSNTINHPKRVLNLSVYLIVTNL